jgi:glycosyltransferase involved in cell wall biosynthesis
VISVIVPSYNQVEALLECLDALRVQDCDPGCFEVIVVDTGSTDGTRERLQGLRYPFPLTVLAAEGGGVCQARNDAARVAKGEWLVFTGANVLPARDWLRHAKDHFEVHQELDLLEGVLVDEDSGTSSRRFEGGRIPSFPPLNLFVRKSTFERLGGFNPAFDDRERHLQFRGDADFGMRLLDAGGRIALASNVVVRCNAQFTSARELFGQMRLHQFDALLYRNHPFRFRQIIEVKNLFGLPVRRLQHIISLGYGTAFVWCLVALAAGRFYEAFSAFLAVAACALLFRYKYQGTRAFQIYRTEETLGFLVAPFLYLWWIMWGAIRYRALGVLLP